MKFAVIVVAYVGDEGLSRALDSVLNQRIDRGLLEICVVANRPHPECRERYEKLIDTWVEPGENTGCAGGRNLGVKHTRAPILTFIDDDGILEPDFFTSMEKVLQEYPHALAVRGKITPLHYPMACLLAPFYDLGDTLRECVLLEGVTCMPREDFEGVGGYDDSIFHGEGRDLQERLLARRPEGVILYNPEAVMRHDFAEGLLGLWKKGIRANSSAAKAKAATPLSDKHRERCERLYPTKRPSLWTRIYKSPAEIAFRAGMTWQRFFGRS